jgi:hypothetical protein
MKQILRVLVLATLPLLFAEPCLGQDALADDKIRGLKGLGAMAVVVRPNTPREFASLKDWGDMVEVGLRRNIPEVKLSDAKTTPTWLELSIITTDAGGSLELSLYRWVKILDSGQETFSKVWWDSRVVFGSVSKQSLQESLDDLLTSFAADYFRAKR